VPVARRPSILARTLAFLVSLDWLFLVLIMPVVLFPRPVTSPVLLLIPLFWWLRRLAYGYFIPSTPLDWPLFLILLMVMVSLFVTVDPSFSFPKVAGMVFGIGVFYSTVVAVQGSWRRLWLGIGALFACGWGVAILGMASGRWIAKLPLFGTLIARLPQRWLTFPGAEQGVNTNEIGGVLLWVAPLALVLAFVALQKRGMLQSRLHRSLSLATRLLLPLTSLFLAGVLLLTQSRAALVGFAVAIFFALIFLARQRGRWIIALAILAFLLGVALVGYLLASGGGEIGLLSENGSQLVDSDVMNTVEGRLEIWSRALYAIEDFPLTGLGMNMFRRIVHILYPMFLIAPNQDIGHAHNHFLQAALDLGLPGLVAYLAVWLLTAAMLWQIWHNTDDVWHRALVIGFAGSLLAYFVYGLVDAVALGARPGFIFWLLLGLIAGLHSQISSRSPTQ
jgi:putative inorganic carbon (HCO3(-)) transporter